MTALHYNNISASDRRAQWRSRANRRIEFTPGNPADRATVLKSNEYVTAAYAEMYLRNPAVYKWAGMAALTSAAVGRGMYMIHYLKQSRMGLADQQPARVERRLQVRMLGGPPFLMPEMLTGRLGQGISLAIGLGSRSGGWVPSLARSS